jgi:hypothetical protein
MDRGLGRGLPNPGFRDSVVAPIDLVFQRNDLEWNVAHASSFQKRLDVT